MAINTSIKAGNTVQIDSISCPSIMYLLYDLLNKVETTMYSVRIVISDKMIMAWSWKNKICSMVMEVVSWKDNAIQIGI